MMENSRKNHEKITQKSWKITENSWENRGKIRGKSWKIH